MNGSIDINKLPGGMATTDLRSLEQSQSPRVNTDVDERANDDWPRRKTHNLNLAEITKTVDTSPKNIV